MPDPVATPAVSAQIPASPNPASVDPAAAYLDYLASQGVDLRRQGITDARALTDALQELLREQQQYQQHQPALQQYLSQREQFSQWQAQQQQQPATPAKPGWTAPDFDPSWMARLIYNPATGEYVPRNENDWGIASKANQYVHWQQNVQRDFARDPVGMLSKAGLEDYIAERAKKLVEEQINPLKQTFEQQLAQARQEAVIAQYQQMLYSLDASGNSVPTAFGQKIQERMNQSIAGAKAMGFEVSEVQQQKLMMQLIQQERQQASQVPTQTQQVVPDPAVPTPVPQPQVPTNGTHQPVNRVQDVIRRTATVNQQVPVNTHTPSTPNTTAPDPRSGPELRQAMIDEAKAQGIPL